MQLQQEVGGRLSPAQGAALVRCGAAGLVAQLEEEAEAALPEVLRPHPKVCVCVTVINACSHLVLLSMAQTARL
jgi:hypothetical protein